MNIVIEGAGEVGSHLAKMLRAEDNTVTVIDSDSQRLNKLNAYTDVETICGNPSSIGVLKQAGVAKADLFIAVFPFAAQEVNLVGALLAKQLGAQKVIARINDEDWLSAENKLMFKEMGIELMFYPERSAADEITNALQHGGSTDTMDFARGKLQISVFKIDEESPLVDRTLEDFIRTMQAEEATLFRIIAVSRGEKTIIPNSSTKFLYGDLVFTIAKREGMGCIARYFGKNDISVKRIMIFGGSSIGRMVARSMSRKGLHVKILDKDKERCVELSEALSGDILIVHGDGRNSDFLYEEGIRDYDAFVALTGSDETNVLACVMAKKFGVPRTIAEVENIEYLKIAEEMGVDTVINKKLITAARIFKFTLSGRARFVKYMPRTDAEIIEYTVAPGSAITKAPLKDLQFPKNAIISGVIRGNEAFIAIGSTQIEAYDRVAIFALPQTINEIDRFFK